VSVTSSQDAAAFHGIATDAAFPMSDRLGCALQALDWYRKELLTGICSAGRDKCDCLDQVEVVGCSCPVRFISGELRRGYSQDCAIHGVEGSDPRFPRGTK
jgi:hypothetical protein